MPYSVSHGIASISLTGAVQACVTIASVVSAFFWVLALLTAFDDGASTIIAAVLESGVGA